VRRGSRKGEERRLRLLAVADDVVVRLGRVCRRLPHYPRSPGRRRHTRRIGDDTLRRRRLSGGDTGTSPLQASAQRARAWCGVFDCHQLLQSGPRRTASQNFFTLANVANQTQMYYLLGLVHFPIPIQNIFSYTYHIKSFDACMKH
jgi:hypothetical protein